MATFFAMLWAPALEERFELIHYRGLNENRLRTPRPTDFDQLYADGAPFARRYEQYFNDTFGFRDLLVRIKNQVDYSLFRENDKIIVGRDGFLFYKSVVDQEEVYTETAPPEAFDRMLQRLERLRTSLSSRGITLVLVPCPMNDTIYREMLPRNATRRPNPTGFDRYRAYLRKHPEFVTIDAEAMLRDLKKQFRVYHKTDFHWTDPAGARVGRVLVDELAERSGIGPLWSLPIETQIRRDSDGGESSAMGLLFPLEEDRLYLKADHAAETESHVTRWVAANEWTYESGEGPNARLIPSTVMFGDSFADAFLRAGAIRYFRRFQKYSNYDLGKKFWAIPEGTRFVIIEHIETVLFHLMNDDIWPPEFRVLPGEPVEPASYRTGVSGRLQASPNPVPVCEKTGLGSTVVSWTFAGTRAIEVRVGAPDGPLFAAGEGPGSAPTGQWVTNGTTLFLQDAANGAGRTPDKTIARLMLMAKPGPCPP